MESKDLRMGSSFNVWLNSRLKELSVDESVFGDYISSIVDDDCDLETKKTSLTDLLQDLLEVLLLPL